MAKKRKPHTTPPTRATEHTTTAASHTDHGLREGETITVPVVAEELTAGVRTHEAGRARIVKDVVEEQHTITVPVQHEEVYVTEHAVNRAATQADVKAMRGTIEIPLKEQAVVTQKQAVVTGEVSIHKEVTQETQRVSDTVRREEVHVEGGTEHVHVEGEDMGGRQRTRR